MKKLLLIYLSFFSLPVLASSQRNITFDDLYGYKELGDISLSPDGKEIIFELTEYDLENNSSRTGLWMISTKGGKPRRFTNGDDTQPCWSHDAKTIAFISERKGEKTGEKTAQIWLISVDGGEAIQLTDISTEASSPVWSHDNKMILFKSSVYPDCPDDDCNKNRTKEIKSSGIKAKLYDHLLFRLYQSWENGKRNHLFICDSQTGKFFDLTPFDNDVPPIVLAGGNEYAFSPDDSEVCFVMNTDSVIAISTNNDIFTISLPNKHLTRITTNPGNDTDPKYSPDSRYIAYKSMARPGFESDQRNLMLYDRAKHTIINLTENFDRSIGQYIWGPYSKYIYFTAIDRGKSKIYRLSIKKGEIKTLVDDAVCWNITISNDGNYLYYLKSTSIQPYEIYKYNNKNGRQKRLTFFDDSLFSQLKLSAAEDFWFTGTAGVSIHGLLTLPPDFDPDGKYPLALLIHGGPQWCWLSDFNYYSWNTQLVAGQGYIVVQIDPHGSCGYGQAFADAVTGDWGGKPYEDLMLGLDYLIAKYDFIDSTKMAALGRSYGGFMVNWICGHTDRFACLISVAGVFDQISEYYSTDELWFPNWEFGGTPWQNEKAYREASPSEYVQNFKTPTLIVHGQNDYRVDVSQGLMMFTALQAKGVPSQLLYFPDEGHFTQKLNNIRYFYQVQLDWLEKYLK